MNFDDVGDISVAVSDDDDNDDDDGSVGGREDGNDDGGDMNLVEQDTQAPDEFHVGPNMEEVVDDIPDEPNPIRDSNASDEAIEDSHVPDSRVPDSQVPDSQLASNVEEEMDTVDSPGEYEKYTPADKALPYDPTGASEPEPGALMDMETESQMKDLKAEIEKLRRQKAALTLGHIYAIVPCQHFVTRCCLRSAPHPEMFSFYIE